MSRSHIEKILRNKYGSYLKRKDVAHELGIAYSTLTQYSELNEVQLQNKLYPLIKIIDFIYNHRIVIRQKAMSSKNRYFEILYWLYIKFDKILISKNEYLQLIDYNIKLARLNDRIEEAKEIPSFYKYRSFRFCIGDIARYLATKEWFTIPISTENATLHFDTLRFMIRNFDANRLLEYFVGHGYSVKKYMRAKPDSSDEYIYKYEIYFSVKQKDEPCMFRLTKNYTNDSLPGVSLEFFGLKTYHDSLDKRRRKTLSLFFIFVNINSLTEHLSVTKMDVAFDFLLKSSSVQLFHNRKETSEKYQYYETSLENLKLLPKIVCENARVTKISENDNCSMKSYIDDGYDIVITDKAVKISYQYLQKNEFPNIPYLKLVRNTSKIYDKAKKARLYDSNLTRVELTCSEVLAYRDFTNNKKLQQYILKQLNNYYLYINSSLYLFDCRKSSQHINILNDCCI